MTHCQEQIILQSRRRYCWIMCQNFEIEWLSHSPCAFNGSQTLGDRTTFCFFNFAFFISESLAECLLTRVSYLDIIAIMPVFLLILWVIFRSLFLLLGLRLSCLLFFHLFMLKSLKSSSKLSRYVCLGYSFSFDSILRSVLLQKPRILVASIICQQDWQTLMGWPIHEIKRELRILLP